MGFPAAFAQSCCDLLLNTIFGDMLLRQSRRLPADETLTWLHPGAGTQVTDACLATCCLLGSACAKLLVSCRGARFFRAARSRGLCANQVTTDLVLWDKHTPLECLLRQHLRSALKGQTVFWAHPACAHSL